MSGMTLGIANNEEGQPIYSKLIDISDGSPAEIGWIDLKLAKKEGGVINSESFINICMGDYILDLAEGIEEEDDHMMKSSIGTL